MSKSYSQTESIQRTPQQIFEWLNSWDHVKSWMGPSLVSIEMLSDHAPDAPMCKGMAFRETRKMGKMNAKATVTIEQHEIISGVLHHKAVFDDGCNRMLAHYVYEPTTEGCDATWTMSSAPDKWWAKAINIVAGPIMLKMVAKCEADHLARLKGLVEPQ